MFSLNYLIIAFIAGYLACAFTVIIGGWFYKIEKGWLDAKSESENSKCTNGVSEDISRVTASRGNDKVC